MRGVSPLLVKGGGTGVCIIHSYNLSGRKQSM